MFAIRIQWSKSSQEHISEKCLLIMNSLMWEELKNNAEIIS